MADDDDKPKIFSMYAIHYYRKAGKRGSRVQKIVVPTGNVVIDWKNRRATAHFHATPTGNWGWDMFGVPYGDPVPELLKDEPERPADKEQPGDEEEQHGLFSGADETPEAAE
jgi:hypothetical protein